MVGDEKSDFPMHASGARVQVWPDETTQPDSADQYEAVTWPACARVHLVNGKTGRTLGDREK